MGVLILVVFGLLALASANGIAGNGDFDFGISDEANASDGTSTSDSTSTSDGLPTCDGVVAVGGLGRVTGVFYAALLIGVLDFVLKKYLPQGGTLFIYALTILFLLWRPQGLFRGHAT